MRHAHCLPSNTMFCMSNRNSVSNCSQNRVSWLRWQRVWADWRGARTPQSMQNWIVWAIRGWSSVTRPTTCRARERRICRGLRNTTTASLQWRPCLSRCPRSGTIWPGAVVNKVNIKMIDTFSSCFLSLSGQKHDVIGYLITYQHLSPLSIHFNFLKSFCLSFFFNLQIEFQELSTHYNLAPLNVYRFVCLCHCPVPFVCLLCLIKLSSHLVSLSVCLSEWA